MLTDTSGLCVGVRWLLGDSLQNQRALTRNHPYQCALQPWILCEWYKRIQCRYSALSDYSHVTLHMLHILTLPVWLEIHTVFSPVIYMSLFAKVKIFLCFKNARWNAWSGMTEPSLSQSIRASPGFSLDAWEFRHRDGNKILFSSVTKKISLCCSHLYWAGFTLVWLY